jgi:DNA-binding CsgD family transcriptional regulator
MIHQATNQQQIVDSDQLKVDCGVYLPGTIPDGSGRRNIFVVTTKVPAGNTLTMGASDFIEKPLNRQFFLSAVEAVVRRNARIHQIVGDVLTKTEMIVLRLILDNKSTKEIAALRHRSVRTTEAHRSRIMRKLSVNNAVDLVKQAALLSPVELPINEQ